MRPLWFRDTAPLPPLHGRQRADLCVIGLGGSGLSAIREARALGLSVIGIDAQQVAAGAAGRNGGFLMAGPPWFHHDARERFGCDLALRLYEATMEQIADMARETDAVRRVGSLRIATDDREREDIETHLQALREDQLPGEPYDGPEGKGLLVPTDAVFDPFRRCQQLAERATEDGARLYGETEALEIESGLVHCSAGQIEADTILVCVDGALRHLFPELPVRTWRLQMLGTRPLDRRLTERAVYQNFGYEYWQQLPDRRLVLGGGRDVGGAAEETSEETPSDVVQAHLEQVLATIANDAEVTHRWAGIVTYSEDGLPIVAEVRPRVFAAGAYCGTGNVIGALVGRDLARRAVNHRTSFLDLLDEARSSTR